jgi:threonine/homoserine/homoserine lactone efflux protein
MSWSVWTLFAITEAALCLSPGPAVAGAVPGAGGALAGRLTPLATRPRFSTLANRVAGSLLVTAGVGLTALRRA